MILIAGAAGASAQPTTTPVPTPSTDTSVAPAPELAPPESPANSCASSATTTPATTTASTPPVTPSATTAPTLPACDTVPPVPSATTTTPTSTEISAPEAAPEQAPTSDSTITKKIPFTGLPTENPNDTVIPGKMRSDREEIPEGFTKEDADKAEIDEANLLKQRSMQRGVSALAAPTDCMFYWPAFGIQVCGEIRVKYDSLGGSNSFLSFPTANDVANPDNYGRRQTFVNGPIYWSPATGAHPVVNSFLFRWGQNNYEAGRLKYPTTDEIVLPDGGRRQEFQQGAIYVAFQNAVGAAVFNGPLRDKYNSVGGLEPGTSFLGYPTEDQRFLPDGQGEMDRFQNGVIYSHPTYGAHVVSGTILQDWAAAGYETSTFGYPTGDAVQTADIWYNQQFQNGTISGTIVIDRGMYWPIKNPAATASTARQQDDDVPLPGENYESDVLPCLDYELEGTSPLAAFKVDGIAMPIILYCERFRTHMAPNPAVSGNPGHFSNYPPTSDDWYDFLGCTFYTFNGENYPDANAPNFGRQRGNDLSGVNSVAIGNQNNGTFVTGWAGANQYSSQWNGCVQGLTLAW